MNDLGQYLTVRNQIRIGDIVAFAGRAPISHLINLFSGSPISHCAIVRQGVHPTDPGSGDVKIAESTIENGRSGPQTRYLGDTLANYGDSSQAWWLPLSEDVRTVMKWQSFYTAIGSSEAGVRYDKIGLTGFILRGIPAIGPRIMQSEPAKRMFCSGLVVEVLEAGGVLRGVNFSKTSPGDITSMKLYSKAVQLIGAPATIPRFNTI